MLQQSLEQRMEQVEEDHHQLQIERKTFEKERQNLLDARNIEKQERKQREQMMASKEEGLNK